MYIVTSNHLNTLSDYRHKKVVSAEDGEKGMPNLCHGRNGEDLILEVPVGTLVYDVHTNMLLHDLDIHDQKVLIAYGGRG